MQHAMIDLETLSTEPNAVIKSIGAIDFDPMTGKVGDDAFHVSVYLQDREMKKGHVSASTLEFWMKQEAPATDIFKRSWTDLPLDFSLWQLDRWITAKGVQYVWGYGSNFDISVVEFWCKQCNVAIPWKYRDVRCARTVLALAEVTMRDYPAEIQHNAVFDAQAQIYALFTAYEKLGLVYAQQ